VSRASAETRVAVVTGGGSGIGAATAALLASKGLGVAVVGRTEAKLDAVVGAITAAGGRAWGVPADVADPGAAVRIVADVERLAGRLDVIVNNAAAIKVGPIESFAVEDFDAHVATNLRAPFLLVQQALPLLRRSPSAAVVNVSSVVGSPAVKAGNAVYGTTKAALEYLTRALAHELAADGIRVNCISPGSVVTPIHEGWAGSLERARADLGPRIPLGRMGEPEEIAWWIWQLAAPETAWCTGTTINVDGGQALGPAEAAAA
jgi:meso-butanediol dehydrogenase / (S,S)-butanediol dehydrogenase / diacetyl reductase